MTTFVKLDATDISEIAAAAEQLMANLYVLDRSPVATLAALDTFLVDACGASVRNADDEDWEQLAFGCGSLWGMQLVQSLGWQWIRVRFNDEAPEAIGVCSGDASLVIYPFQTVFLYCEGRLPIRVARCFEILTQPGRVPMLPPAGLENVMDHID